MHYPYADVVLPLAIPQAYTYCVPLEYRSQLREGARVVVPLRGNKLYMGIVWRLHDEAPRHDTLRDIIEVVDRMPIITERQRQLWSWMSDYYLCTLGDLLQATLPPGLKMEREALVEICDAPPHSLPALTPDEEAMLETIRSSSPIAIKKLFELRGERVRMRTVQRLVDHGIVRIVERLSKREKPKLESVLHLADSFSTPETLRNAFALLGRAEAQERLLLTLVTLASEKRQPLTAGIRKGEAMERANVSPSVLKGLEEKGIVEVREVEVSRFAPFTNDTAAAHELSAAQMQALHELETGYGKHKVMLLHGVTGSGKTEIYIRMMEEVLQEGRQVLYLLPEIALTAQIINRLRKVFGDRVGVYHSRQSDHERVEVYRGIGGLNEDRQIARFDILLGARSSIFLPFRDLGLIIVDEEHDPSYKQVSPAPRYNGRDMAVVLAGLHDARVLLGSATPSIESYRNAETGKYGLVELSARFGRATMPELELVDLRRARHRKEMHSHFSHTMLERIRDVLADKGQVILFQNRRGFSSYIECSECGWVAGCPNCDVSLTFHKTHAELSCHYCGHREPIAKECPACGSLSLLQKGLGTQRVEEELLTFIPEVNVGRLDLDTTRAKEGASGIIEEFSGGKLNVLVGTQMVTKGLDFDNVQLVGVLDADTMLRIPDFRATERAFHLLAQVGGRAGRREKPGALLVQTQQPEHPIFDWVRRNAYKEFYQNILEERSRTLYPPAVRLIMLTVRHREQALVQRAGERLAAALKTTLGSIVLGPQAPVVAWVARFHLMQILIKIPLNANRSAVKGVIAEAVAETSAERGFSSVRIDIDVDPL